MNHKERTEEGLKIWRDLPRTEQNCSIGDFCEVHACTMIARAKSGTDDRFYVDRHKQTALVADGAGGIGGSRKFVDAFIAAFVEKTYDKKPKRNTDPDGVITDLVNDIHAAATYAVKNQEFGDAPIAFARIAELRGENHVILGSLGDCRGYAFMRDGKKHSVSVTADDTLPNGGYGFGLRSLGDGSCPREYLFNKCFYQPFNENTTFGLFSDGAWGPLEDELSHGLIYGRNAHALAQRAKMIRASACHSPDDGLTVLFGYPASQSGRIHDHGQQIFRSIK